MIVQGSNTSIKIPIPEDMDLQSIENAEVCLYYIDKTEFKHWDFEDLVFSDDGNIECNLTQGETIAFKPGAVHIELKWLDGDGIIHTPNIINDTVVYRKNHRVLGTDGTITGGTDHDGDTVSYTVIDDNTVRLTVTKGGN